MDDRPLIIEFIGPTSSGKSTYVRNLLRESVDSGMDVALADEIILGRLNSRLKGRVIRSLVVDLAIMTRLFSSVFRCRRQIRLLALAAMARNDSLFMRINIIRNAIKHLARFDHLARTRVQKTIIFDEGPLQACMNAFIHYEDDVDEEQLLSVTSGLRLASVVAVVSASEQAVIDRSRARPDQAFEGLQDHHWAAIRASFEKVLPKVLAEHEDKVRVIEVDSQSPPSTEEFWRQVREADLVQ